MSVETPIMPFSDYAHITTLALAALLFSYFVFRGIILEGGVYAWLNIKGERIKNRIYNLPYGNGQIKKELGATVWIMICDALVVSGIAKYLNTTSPGASVMLTFVIAFVWVEVWFYISHRLMHHKSLYFIHKQHHVAKVTSPITSTSFSILERLFFHLGAFGVLLSLGLWMPISAFGLALYFIANYFLNIYGHSNVEWTPPSLRRHALGRFLFTPTYHALHHARYQGHYGLFTPFMDHMFQTRFEDYESVHERAYGGNGLKSLSESFPK